MTMKNTGVEMMCDVRLFTRAVKLDLVPNKQGASSMQSEPM